MTNFSQTALSIEQVSQHNDPCNKSFQIVKSATRTISSVALLIVLILTSTPVFSSNNPVSDDNNQKRTVYRVRKGDRLNEIAYRYGTSVEAIKYQNGLYSSTLREGQSLIIPANRRRRYADNRVQRRTHSSGFQPKSVPAQQTARRVQNNVRMQKAYDPANPHVIVNGTSSGVILVKQNQKAWITENSAVQQTRRQPATTQDAVIGRMNTGQQERLNKRPGFQNEKLYRPDFMGSVETSRQELKATKSMFAQDAYDLSWKNMNIANVRDNIPSKYAVKKDGVQYASSSKVTRADVLGFGFDEKIADAFSFVSSNEGGVSDINFYDGHGSFGFIQFTITYGSLEKLLAHIKTQKPEVFKANFEKYGFTLEERMNDQNKVVPKLVVYAPEGYKGSHKVEGNDIVDYLNANKELFVPFILLGEQTRLEQIESAHEQYYLPALSNKLDIKGVKEGVKASEIFTTNAGITALVDLTVKSGATGAKQELEAALNSIASRTNATLNEIIEMDELQIIQEIKKLSKNDLVKKRMGKLIQENQMVAAR